MPFTPFAPAAVLAKQADTGAAGVALINGTQTILTWTPPNDGNVHVVYLIAELNVTVAETGGQVNLNFTGPDGGSHPRQQFASGLGVGAAFASPGFLVQGGQQITLTQPIALTVGAATLWAQFWGE